MATFPEMKPIPGLAGYFASRCGRIFSDVPRPPRHPRGLIEIKVQTKGNRTGHRSFTVAGRRTFYVHRSVALAWIGPEPDGQMVCHNDGNPTHNHVDNLRWDTMAGNMADKEAHGTLLRGDSHPSSKLTAEQVAEIRSAYAARAGRKWGCSEFARRFGVGVSTVCLAAQGKQWRHL